ncbi:PREDICTED: extracellular tyrosine-protein kinase PKDCC-like isoform X2 [Priapulus caudatus]|nr:PREDICTED: extracellular tyrosine-protein kinase PKDCC-like isoform X2 [Priapulus caudatus]XP_014681491.1 PREDICTED: extracellular tyrosine-protein kinase PKDCC-like isoform X2 [Priapulus caudatus]
MVTELGEPVDIIKLLQMSWEDRLRVALGMARILVKLAHSSHGSLAMNDFRRQQFVLVDGVLKLADVDDVTAGEPTCNEEADCLQRHPDTNLTLGGKCINHCCSEFNERRNIMNGGRQFVSFFLEHGVPRSLLPLVMKLSSIYTNVTGNTRQLSEVTETLAHMYINGSYLDYSTLKKHRTLYKVIHDADLPGMFDYRCQLTLSANGCSFSVFNVREAEEVCSADTYCKAFILAKEKTWTGRTIVHLKNNFTTPVRTTGSLIYVKPQPG